jgi:hypothetical protein
MNTNLNIFFLFFFYFFVIFSITGFGLLFSSLIFKRHSDFNIGYCGIFGLFFTSIYSYITSNFFAHSLNHNFFFNFLGTVLFIYFFFKDKKKNDYYLFLLVFLILFCSILAHKSHDDFGYYHFPYTYFLTQFSSVYGLGFYDLGFRTPSSLFYINSLFYLPVASFYLFNVTAVLIMGFSNIILLNNILNSFKSNTFNFVSFLSLILIAFINIFFYRISEHGTDLSAQILILILVLDLLIITNFYNKSKIKVNSLLILISLIISFKAFYILYSIFVLYLFYFLLINKNLIEIIKKNYFNILLCLTLILLVLITNFQITGCLIYPVSLTCFYNFPWSLDLNEVENISKWYEQWSKAGAGPNFRVDNSEIYIENFNWVKHWFFNYFIGKGSDLFFGLIFLLAIFFIIFYSKDKKNSVIRNYKLILLILTALLFEWFYKHPAFRYGGYCLVVLIFFIPFSIFLENFNGNHKKIIKKYLLTLIIVFAIFFFRNVYRIYKEINKYDFQPIKHSSYMITNDYLGIVNKVDKLIININNCNSEKLEGKKCSDFIKVNNVIVGKFLGKYYFKSVND